MGEPLFCYKIHLVTFNLLICVQMIFIVVVVVVVVVIVINCDTTGIECMDCDVLMGFEVIDTLLVKRSNVITRYYQLALSQIVEVYYYS